MDAGSIPQTLHPTAPRVGYTSSPLNSGHLASTRTQATSGMVPPTLLLSFPWRSKGIVTQTVKGALKTIYTRCGSHLGAVAALTNMPQQFPSHTASTHANKLWGPKFISWCPCQQLLLISCLKGMQWAAPGSLRCPKVGNLPHPCQPLVLPPSETATPKGGIYSWHMSQQNIFLETKAYRAASISVLGWEVLWGSGGVFFPPQNHPSGCSDLFGQVYNLGHRQGLGRAAVLKQSQRCSLIHLISYCWSILVIFH